MADAFTKLSAADIQKVLGEVNPLVEGSKFDASTATILGQDLDFYPGYRILDVADFSTLPPRQRFVIYKPRHAIVLDGTNEPLYALNKTGALLLNEETVASYVRFFFNYVQGRHGKFVIAESIDDVAWREEPPPAARKAVGDILLPLQMVGSDDTGGFKLEARMVFRESIFKTDITVATDGTVSLSNEELLIEDMPVLDSVLGQ